jgi:hypothetical protein
MAIHDWARVDAGIFHAFHHGWIEELSRALNRGLLPEDYYALPEQIAGGLGPDVLTLQDPTGPRGTASDAGTVATAPQLRRRPTTSVIQSAAEFYRRKKSAIIVRHVSGDRVVAIVEVVSPGNKDTRNSLQAFVNKVCELLERRIHMLVVDLFPPGRRDPNGIHGAVWDCVRDDAYTPPPDKPLTLVSYECEMVTRAYVEAVAIGDPLPEMPLFLEPDGCVMVPLERTYQAAFAEVPRRWRTVLESPRS